MKIRNIQYLFILFGSDFALREAVAKIIRYTSLFDVLSEGEWAIVKLGIMMVYIVTLLMCKNDKITLLICGSAFLSGIISVIISAIMNYDIINVYWIILWILPILIWLCGVLMCCKGYANIQRRAG
jgi:hypothetical protein